MVITNVVHSQACTLPQFFNEKQKKQSLNALKQTWTQGNMLIGPGKGSEQGTPMGQKQEFKFV